MIAFLIVSGIALVVVSITYAIMSFPYHPSPELREQQRRLADIITTRIHQQQKQEARPMQAGDRVRPITESGHGNPGTVLAVWEDVVWFLPDRRPGWAWTPPPYTVRTIHLEAL